MVRGRGPARGARFGSLVISAAEPEQLDGDPVRVPHQHQGERDGLGPLDHRFVLDSDGVEVVDPRVDRVPAGDLKGQVVQPGAVRAESLPVGVRVVVEADEQPGARPGHHYGVAVVVRVRVDESPDKPEDLRVPRLR